MEDLVSEQILTSTNISRWRSSSSKKSFYQSDVHHPGKSDIPKSSDSDAMCVYHGSAWTISLKPKESTREAISAMITCAAHFVPKSSCPSYDLEIMIS